MEENELTYIKDILSLNQEFKELEIVNDVLELDSLNNIKDININLDISYPYLVFNSEELIKVIDLCNKIVLNKSNNVIYNSITLVPDLKHKRLYFYVTNELSYFRYNVELLGNIDEMFSDIISIPINSLQKIIRLIGNKTLIYKKDNLFYIRIQNGDLLLDNIITNLDIIKFPSNPTEMISEVKISNLYNITNSVLPLLNSEVSLDNKKITFLNNKAYFISSSYYLESNIRIPDFTLSLKDTEFINKLFKYYKNDSILLFKTDASISRLYLKVGNVEYEFLYSNPNKSSLYINQMNALLIEPQLEIQLLDLYKIVNLASILPTSTGIIKFEIKDDLNITITTNKGDSNFNLKYDKISDLYKGEILCRASLLKRLLASFKQDKIKIALSDNCIYLDDGYSKAILITYK